MLHEGAGAVWRDAFLAHDAGGEGGFRLEAETILRRPGAQEPLALDRYEVDRRAAEEGGAGGPWRVHAAMGWAGEACGAGLAESVRKALAGLDGVYGGVSPLPGGAGLFARLAARDGASLQRALDRVEGAPGGRDGLPP